MKVYFKQAWGIFFIITGIILFMLNLMLMNLGSQNVFQVFFSLFICFIGAMYLSKPYFELRTNEIVLFNLFGMEIKRYRFEKYSDLQLLDGKIYLLKEGKSVKLRLSKSMARNDQWDEFIRTIQGNDLTNELHNI